MTSAPLFVFPYSLVRRSMLAANVSHKQNPDIKSYVSGSCLCSGVNVSIAVVVFISLKTLLILHKIMPCMMYASGSLPSQTLVCVSFVASSIFCYIGVFIPIDTMQHWWWLEKALLAVTC